MGGRTDPVIEMVRPRVGGKFVELRGRKFYVRGVTYGTFREQGGDPFPGRDVVVADFAGMVDAGINTVRVYTVPPTWLLDLASECGLMVLVGIPWEQHIAFLDDRARRGQIEETVRQGVRACAGHPAVLAYAIGNEIPASIVRWHGRRRIERFLERLYRAAKDEDPGALVTYVNFPSTEYLHLPFVDLVCFNVFLEDEAKLDDYLARLHNLAGDRPVLVTELGLDSLRNGVERQAVSVGAQVRTAFAAGCAGCFVFAWTDEWHRGGHEVIDWEFGLVDRLRSPKPALAEVSAAFADAPFPEGLEWPSFSVAVCTYNGSATIGECVDSLLALDYPDVEIVVVDDGSSDAAGEIAAARGVRVLRTNNQGLAAARNLGIEATTGELVAFCDDDCQVDPQWLRYLATSFATSTHAGIGGPNIPPPDTLVADCVGHAPGGPVHVLLSDRIAEHIPGCNMAFQREALEAIGGFDEQFVAAGDDVDVCWRVQTAGGTLGFSPAAMVWHRRRQSVRAYLRQQAGYGRAEALLERKWPERYNRGGHVEWSGEVYGGEARRLPGRRRWHVYYGSWGSGLFQSVYQRRAGRIASLPLMPEWYLLLVALAVASVYDLAYGDSLVRLRIVLPISTLLLLAASGVLAVQAVLSAWSVVLAPGMSRRRRLSVRLLTTALFLAQPVARLWGRMRHGLTPWRRHGTLAIGLPKTRKVSVWSEHWRSPDQWLRELEARLKATSSVVVRGGPFDTWDLQVRIGSLNSARIRMGVEEHSGGRQLVRFKVWPCWSLAGVGGVVALAALTATAAVRDLPVTALVVGLIALIAIARLLSESAASLAVAAREAESSAGEIPEAEAEPTHSLTIFEAQMRSTLNGHAEHAPAPKGVETPPRRFHRGEPSRERA